MAPTNVDRVAKPTVAEDLILGESGALGEPVGALITPLDNPNPGQPDGGSPNQPAENTPPQ